MNGAYGLQRIWLVRLLGQAAEAERRAYSRDSIWS